MPNGREIASPVNALLSLPFALKVATRDWHPPNHVSFAANHPGSHPFNSTTNITHPNDPTRYYTTTLWPTHCIQNSTGAQLVPELDIAKIGLVIYKGKNPALEMYSAFYDPFHIEDSGLADRLRDDGITDVFVVGLAADFCVKATAEHAFLEGYSTYIVEEGTRPVNVDGWDECKAAIVASGVKVVSIDGEEVARVMALP